MTEPTHSLALDTPESQHFDRKSLRLVTGGRADFTTLANDCVCFANGGGGVIAIGIEDGADAPPPGQRIDAALPERVRKRVGELTVNVTLHAEIRRTEAGDEYLLVTVLAARGVASTSDGRYFIRVADECRPLVGDDALRLLKDRPAEPWKYWTSLDLPRATADPAKVSALCARLRSSSRVKSSVKEKADEELLTHYQLAEGSKLTNLGVLLVGCASDRARLGTAPIVQALRYDAQGAKIGKEVWDDHALSPIELVRAVWEALPDFRETYEIPDGLIRARVPAYEEAVVREVLVNALVHRPYTQRGDIVVSLYPDRLEVTNPGRLPIGITPRNILHASVRRNEGLARVFHDLELMEREGSGFDLLFERLLASGRELPKVCEGTDSVRVTVPRRVIHPGAIRLLEAADQRYQLRQRERIVLGLLAQAESFTSTELAARLELEGDERLRDWLGRLVDLGLVKRSGRTTATRYAVPPELLRASGLDLQTTLTSVQPHRLRALILEDLERYPDSSLGDVHRRVGKEIPERTFRRAMVELVERGKVLAQGEFRWRTYRAAPIGHEGEDGR